jgi:hypothetical protein
VKQVKAGQPIHDKVQNHQLFKKGEIQVLLSFFLSFFLSFIHSFPDLEIMSLTISMKSIAEQQLCHSIRRRRRRSWNHFRLFLNLSITPGVAMQSKANHAQT